MNIFILDSDIKKNVSYYCDEHIRKMPIETAQMLSYAHHLFPKEDFQLINLIKEDYLHEYSLRRANHPCSKWVRESLSNYQFLVQLGLELCEEFEKRFGHKIISEKIIKWCSLNYPLLPFKHITPYVQCMPDQYKVKTGSFLTDVIRAYKNYYIGEKIEWATWNRAESIPDWLPQDIKIKKKLQKIDWLERQRINSLKIRVGSKILLKNNKKAQIMNYYSNIRIVIKNNMLYEDIKKSDIIEVIKY